jgi:photosystem II stability/assembly factor-like uncharacterized protein
MKRLAIAMSLPILGALNALAQTAPATLVYPKAASAVHYVGQAIVPDTPVTTGGVPISYFVSPQLPGGLVLNASTGILSGTPTAISSGSYTITASNLSGSAQATISITVSSPTGLSYSRDSLSYAVGIAITPDTPHVGVTVTGYSVLPALPPGLKLHATKGIISGTPTTPSTAKVYTISASNAGGSIQKALTITVRPDAFSMSGREGFRCRGLSILDKNLGMALGDLVSPSIERGPAILRTEDGGSTWTEVHSKWWQGSTSPHVEANIAQVVMVNANLAYMTGTPFDYTDIPPEVRPELSRSTNGGESWTKVAYQAADTSGHLGGIAFPDPSTGYLMLGSRLHKTLNGGATLIPIPGIGAPSSFQFKDASTGYVVGPGVLAKTTNGGVSWDTILLPSTPVMKSFRFPTAAVGYALGDSSILFKTTNGGSSWTALPTGAPQNLVSISFPGPDTGFVGGVSGLFMRTTNGGSSWEPQAHESTKPIGSLHFPNGSMGYSCTENILRYTGSVPAPVTAPPAPVAPGTLVYPKAATAVYRVGVAMTPDTPQVTGGAPTSYSVTPELPAGLVLNAATGILSGTPATTSSGGYIISASNPAGITSVSLLIAVTTPSSLSHAGRGVLRGNRLSFTLASPAPVRIRILNLQGREIYRHSENLGAGTHVLTLPAAGAKTGLRVLDFQAGTSRETRLIPAH